MSLETRFRNSSNPGGTGAAGSSNSGGLMGTANFLVAWSADPLITNEKVLTAGSSVTITTDATAIYITAITSASASSAGLAGTGAFYVTYLADGTLSNEKRLAAGSSVTVHTDATTIYINATTSLGAGAGLGRNYFPYLPQQAKLYSNTSAARIDAGTGVWRLLFSATTQQYGVFQNLTPVDYGSSPVARIAFSVGSTISVARSATWSIEQWAWSSDQILTVYNETYGAANTTTVTLAAGYTAGTVGIFTIPLASIVSLAAGNLMKLRVTTTGNFVGDAELEGMSLEYARV